VKAETPATERRDQGYEVDVRRRVKLRTVAGRPAELITHTRPETDGVRVSDYEVTPIRDGACLVPNGRPRLRVRKRRHLLLLDNVRIHLDDVESIGTFLELEAVLDATDDEAACRRQGDALTTALGRRRRRSAARPVRRLAGCVGRCPREGCCRGGQLRAMPAVLPPLARTALACPVTSSEPGATAQAACAR
jgi:hypothetical protein